MAAKGSYSAPGVSLILHFVLLAALAMIPMDLLEQAVDIELETVFTDERQQEEFTQELEIDPQVSESLSIVAQGAVSTQNAGPSAASNAAEKISQTRALQQVNLTVPTANLSVPEVGGDIIGNLEFGQLQGEGSAVVPGYDAAMSRITRELMRMMRESPVMVVWLFDESESMKDDQKEIRDKFHKIYEELGIASKKITEEKKSQRRKQTTNEILLTQINSFGKSMRELTPKPTSDIRLIKTAIDKIPVDESGDENTFQALAAAIAKYNQLARRDDRRLVLIVVSDESGDDDQAIEETIAQAQRANAPIYLMGHESMFGYPWARIRWVDPTYNLPHWTRIRRGPETPFVEALQFDGLHGRWRNFASAFGPYGQVRLAKETGGIFFLLPNEEENLQDNYLIRKSKSYNMKEYEPNLTSRREYVEKVRNPREFRKEIARIIAVLDPEKEEKLRIREHWYPIREQEFNEELALQWPRMEFAFKQMGTALKIVEKIEPLREEEASQRWRAHFDLIHAQLLSYRVRLFQAMLAIDNHRENFPDTTGFNFPLPKGAKPKKDQLIDHWNLQRRAKMLEPTERQIKLTKVDFQALQAEDKRARELYDRVLKEHPNTPWSEIAKYELGYGFGMAIQKGSRSAFYEDVGSKIKIPKF